MRGMDQEVAIQHDIEGQAFVGLGESFPPTVFQFWVTSVKNDAKFQNTAAKIEAFEVPAKR